MLWFYSAPTGKQLAALAGVGGEYKRPYVTARKINPKKEKFKTPANFEKGPLDKTHYLTVTGITGIICVMPYSTIGSTSEDL